MTKALGLERCRKARGASLQTLTANVQALQQQIADLSDTLHRLTPTYPTVPPSSRVIPAEAGGWTNGRELIALLEKDGAFISGEGLPDSPEYARQIREQSQTPREAVREYLSRPKADEEQS